MQTTTTRTETDSLGPRAVPADALYGAQTSRSLENFPFPDSRLPVEIIRGMALLKHACATANERLGVLPAPLASAIRDACDEVLSGAHDASFAVSVYQAGSGTSSHMNLNEVLANLANRRLGSPLGAKSPVHPNDHVNCGQSTNNAFPSGAKLALIAAYPDLESAVSALSSALRAKGREFAAVLKPGRTHLQDAVPVTLGQEFDAWAAALERALTRFEAPLLRLHTLGIGGNAVGTGVNTSPRFRPEIMRALQPLVPAARHPFAIPDDPIAATQSMTDFADFSSALRCLATDLRKLADDLRLLSSGPRTGIGEISLPPVEPGSSIMPGKINPSICESAAMACMHAIGLDAAVALACGAGQLELNTAMPLIAADTLSALRLLAAAAQNLAVRCIPGIAARPDICADHLERSAGLPTLLNPRLGYDRVAALVKESLAIGRTLRELAVEKALLTDAEYAALVASSTRPNRP
jgi:aspartate ammonia-lyase